MIKQYLKQAWRALRAHPILSAISIIATALAIAMMMILVITDRVKTANFPPEIHRDRTLFISRVSRYDKEEDSNINSSTSVNFYKEVFCKMKTPEAISIAAGYSRPNTITTSDRRSGKQVGAVLKVNLDFFKCFEYHVLHGQCFDKGDMASGLKKAILSEAFARKLFGRADVVGESIHINYEAYDVIGVVSTPSNLLTTSYSEVWIPYTAIQNNEEKELGEYLVTILAKRSEDFPKIQAEMEQVLAEYNAQNQSIEISINRDNHLTTWREVTTFVETKGNEEKAAENRRNTIAFMLLFLIVPAINLATLTFSRHEQKLSELGIRRSYGASRGSILHQVVIESSLYTLIGGVLGFLLSIVAVYTMRNLLFLDYRATNFEMSIWQLLNLRSFVIALLICLILNLLSSIIPAWLMSRKDVIDALNRK